MQEMMGRDPFADDPFFRDPFGMMGMDGGMVSAPPIATAVAPPGSEGRGGSVALSDPRRGSQMMLEDGRGGGGRSGGARDMMSMGFPGFGR